MKFIYLKVRKKGEGPRKGEKKGGKYGHLRIVPIKFTNSVFSIESDTWGETERYFPPTDSLLKKFRSLELCSRSPTCGGKDPRA